MDAVREAETPSSAVQLRGPVTVRKSGNLTLRRKSTPAVGNAVADGLARLVEGQRQFAEEFGLPYARVFSDGYESFKGADAATVIKQWFAQPEEGIARLDALFSDLIAHQMALISAADGAVLHALHNDMQRTPDGQLVRLPLWARVVRALMPKRRTETFGEDQTLRYMYLVAPAFVAAYARAREQIAARRQEFEQTT